MIFLPGIGLGELLQVWKEGKTIAERFAWALGIGLSFDTLVFMVRTSGLQIGAGRLVGMDLQTIYFILGVGLVTLSAGLALSRVPEPGLPESRRTRTGRPLRYGDLDTQWHSLLRGPLSARLRSLTRRG